MQVHTIVLGEIEVRKISYPIIVYVLNMNGKYIAIDTGYGSEYIDKLERYSTWVQIRIYKNLDEELNKIGILMSDIKTVIFTHLHFDHAGNLDAFSEDVQYYVNEYEITGLPKSDQSINYHGSYLKNYLHRFIQTVDYYDVFKDGNIKLLLTPGHSKGHQSVLVYSEDESYLFTGDLFYTCDDFLNLQLSGHVENKTIYDNSVKKIHTCLSNTNGKIYIYPGHDIKRLAYDNYQKLCEECTTNGKAF